MFRVTIPMVSQTQICHTRDERNLRHLTATLADPHLLVVPCHMIITMLSRFIPDIKACIKDLMIDIIYKVDCIWRQS